MPARKKYFWPLVTQLCFLLTSLLPAPVFAESSVEADPVVDNSAPLLDDTEQWSLHGQATYVAQWKNKFHSPYVGEKSLLSTGDRDTSYSLTITPYLGARLWEGAEIYYNPEASEGVPFSSLSGLGGFTNGEMQRGNNVPIKFYNARAFLRQTFGFGGGQEHVESGPNQLAGNVDKRRLTVTYGLFAALDYFDGNSYSHDPRTQFLNWSIMAAGAYDFAANARGYTYGFVAEYFDDGWAVRAARLAMPQEPNGLALDYQLTQQYGDQIEFEREHKLFEQDGVVRLLFFKNRGLMATFKDAINQAGAGTPDILTARNGYQTKWGYAINVEQAVAENIGLFGRWSWNNGQTETQAFTDIGKSLSGGAVIKGTSWGRAKDTAGLAFACNGISSSQIDYLSRGGSTMFIGDGQIAYQGERILETYYSFNVVNGGYLSADYQYIRNPAYNADRGPVSFFAVRAHFEI